MTGRDLDAELRSYLHGQVDGEQVELGTAMAAFPDRVDHRRRQRRTLAAVAAAIVAAVIVTLPTVGADRRAAPPAEQQGDEVRTVTPTGTTAVDLGGKPLRLAAARGSVWAALDDGGVVRVDPASGQASTVAELPSSLFDIEVARRWVWVSQPFDKRVQAIDPETGRVVHTVTTGSPGPRGMQLVGDSLWFAAGDELFEVDADTGQVRRTLALPGVTLPYDVAVTGDAAWVTDARSTSVTRLPLSGGPAQQVPVGTGSTGVVAAGGAVWVALAATDNLIRLDPDTGAVLSRPSLPAPGLALNVIGSSVWAGVPDADLVVSFDAASGRQTRRWAVGDYPPYVVGADDAVYVSSNESGEMVRVPLDQR